MAEGSQGGERQSLGKFSSGHRKYGSTEKKHVANWTYMKHQIKPNETLQGIALKYGKTTEELKRVNKLWTSDSLFLREYLFIPLDSAEVNPPSLLNGSANNTFQQSPAEITTKLDLWMIRGSSRDKRLDTIAENNRSDVTAKDFLNKFDNTLAKLRNNAQTLEKTSNFPEDTSNPLNYLPTRRSPKYNSQQCGRSQLDIMNACSESDMMFKPTNSSKKIRSSLEQLEKVHDDMFQL